MLEHIFLKVMDMSWGASIVILIVCTVRILLKRFPKYISYMLWSVVLFRLLCPVVLESKISPVPNSNLVSYEYSSETGDNAIKSPSEDTVSYTDVVEINKAENEQLPSTPTHIDETPIKGNVSWQKLLLSIGKYVWLSGIGLMLLYSVISMVKVRKKILTSIPIKENIYVSDEAISPFVMGITKPKIYLPNGLSVKEQEYIILHEQFHIKRFDHIIKIIAYVALCLHWFNPLVWIAFILFCKDMEMSCDEAVVKRKGENIRADYSSSLLALSTHRRMIGGFPVDFGEGDTKSRVKNLAAFRKTPKCVLAIIISGVVILITCLAFTHKTFISGKSSPNDEINVVESSQMPTQPPEAKPLNLSIDITEHYTTHVGDPSNLYYIDENNILWGSGRNEFGQLGQGTQDYDFHSEMVKIAENVIHVDYSQKGFVIFLTKDLELYGLGNAGCGALQQYEVFDWTQYTNGEDNAVTKPILLMKDVVYACCGRDSIVCLSENGTVWTWGTIYVAGNIVSNNVHFVKKPIKILENAVLITGGWFHHAALLQDGTVWTWGYNSAGNCGIADTSLVSQPTKVAEDVVMVWTNLAVNGYPQPNAEDIANAWTGKLKYNTEYKDISEFDEIYPRSLNNTVILKTDGSYWVCGENVGTEEKVVYGAEGDYTIICTHEFHRCE